MLLPYLHHILWIDYLSEDWMIIDDNRRTAVVHPADQPYYLTSLSEEEMSEFLARESAAKDTDSMTALWKTFFQTIGIKERKNPVCQRNLIPLWYRKHNVRNAGLILKESGF